MKLWVIRHAKSSWANRGQADFDRPLNKRGMADGPRMARWLATQEDPASWIWTSDAVRALATAEFAAQGFAGCSPEIVADHRLYHPTVDSVCEVLRETPSDQYSVALVAHNPGLTQLVNHLAGKPVLDNLPTFGVARFSVQGQWSHFAAATASLELLSAPKQLAEL
jgi:phosphohistidine phosphatase